jgi:hypothetical protein
MCYRNIPIEATRRALAAGGALVAGIPRRRSPRRRNRPWSGKGPCRHAAYLRQESPPAYQQYKQWGSQRATTPLELQTRVKLVMGNCVNGWAAFREKLYLRHALLKVAIVMLETSLSLEPNDPRAGFYRLKCAEHAARMFEDLLSDYVRSDPGQLS